MVTSECKEGVEMALGGMISSWVVTSLQQHYITERQRKYFCGQYHVCYRVRGNQIRQQG